MRTLLECYKILEEYPNGMTKDQFYRVARINKQHAKYLLDSGLVPCINTGKKTRKYHIATHDVITYLCDREDHPEKYKVPTGFYIGKNGCSKRHPDKPRAEIIRFNFTEPEKTGLYTMWEKLTVGYDDHPGSFGTDGLLCTKHPAMVQSEDPCRIQNSWYIDDSSAGSR